MVFIFLESVLSELPGIYFVIGGPIGDYMTNWYLDSNSNFKPFGLTAEDKARLNSSWNYMYFYLWTNLKKYKSLMNDYFPKSPIAFVYGAKKGVMFHGEKFLKAIESHKNSEWKEMDEDHWVMRSEAGNKFLVELIKRRANSLN